MRGVTFILIALLLIIPLASAAVENYNNFSALEIETEITSSAYTVPGLSPRIDELKVNLTFFPKSNGKRQTIVSMEESSEPESEITKNDEAILFFWKDPTEKQFKYKIKAKIKNLNNFNRIKRSVNFPLSELEFEEIPPYQRLTKEVMRYTEPSEFIDFNDDIRKKASEIIAGETDYYKVIFKLADWVEKNIKYDLSTLTAEAVQKSSWVLENKEGVCDELTNLYISFLRSVGIPARFVGGQVYSNRDYKFGNHGWAEVFYPGEGWIPVDVTFGQIGWIDLGHVKFKTSLDSGEPSAEYFWKTRDTDFKMNPLTIKTEVTATIGESEKYVSLLVEPLKKIVGPGSYVPVQVTIINPNDYYVPLQVFITKAPGLTEETKKTLLLSQLEEQQVFWIVEIPKEAEEGMIYTTTIEVQTVFGTTHSTEIKYEKDGEVFSKEWAEEQVKKIKPKTTKEFFPDVSLDCELDKTYYYMTDIAKMECRIKNLGNVRLINIKACYQKDCQSMDLNINEEKILNWDIPLRGFTDERIIMTAESKNMVRQDYVMIDIVEVPDIKIIEFSPVSIKYGEKSNFSFLLKANATAKDIRLEIEDFGYSTLGRFDGKSNLLVPFDSKDFIRGKVNGLLTYKDKAGKSYEKRFKYRVDVTDKPWYLRFFLWIESHLN